MLLRDVVVEHLHNTKIIVVSCDAMTALFSRVSLLSSIGGIGVCSLLMKVWKIHMDNDQVLTSVAHSVAAICAVDENRQRIRASEYYLIVMDTFSTRGGFETSSNLLIALLSSVYEVSRDSEESVDSMYSCGMFPVLTWLLGSQKNVDILKLMCQIMTALLKTRPDLGLFFADVGVCA